MYYAYKYRLTPSDAHREELDRHRDICRQLYNHTLYRLNEYQDERGVEHSFSRSTRCRSGTLRITACGDCAPVDTDTVSAKRVVETGSPTLKERTASAVSE